MWYEMKNLLKIRKEGMTDLVHVRCGVSKISLLQISILSCKQAILQIRKNN